MWSSVAGVRQKTWCRQKLPAVFWEARLYLDKDWHLRNSAHPLNKVPGQCVIHVAVEDVDSASCAYLVVGLYSERQLPEILIC